MLRRLGISVVFLALACSSKVELSSAPQVTSSTDPNVLVQINEQVSELEVDADRVYWAGSRPSSAGGTTFAFRSCLKSACATSLVSYAAENLVSHLGFDVQNGEVYWFEQEYVAVDSSSMQDPYHWVLLTCPAAGCGLSAPRRIASGDLFTPISGAFADGTAYVAGVGQIVSMSLAGTQVTPVSLVTEQSLVSSLAIGGDYLYELTGDYGGDQPTAALRRVRLDGSEPAQTLAQGLKIPYPDNVFPNQRLAVDSQYVYWSQGTQYGSIARCPLSGCSDTPEVLVEPIYTPTTVRLDHGNLYWQHATRSQGYAISSCSLAACTPSMVVTGVDANAALALDADYLYTGTADHVSDPSSVWLDPVARISRFPK